MGGREKIFRNMRELVLWISQAFFLQAGFIVEECTVNSGYADNNAKLCFDYLKNVSTVADYVAVLYERCYNLSMRETVKNCGYDIRPFSSDPNVYNRRYHLDTPKRRGYATAYYNCIKLI